MTTANVDSANTTAIEYDSYGASPWTLTQTANNGAIFGQTLTRVQGTGGAVFRFHGTSVQVYGSVAVPTVSGATVVSLYALDGGNTMAFSSSSVPNARVNEVDGQLFFDSGTLSDDGHVLVINVTTASEGAPYLLDYIRFVATDPPASTTTTSTSATQTATIGPSSGGSSKSNVGPIVGGVVGGVVGLLVLVAAGFFYWRAFKRRVRLGRTRQPTVTDIVEGLVDEPKPDSDSSAPFAGHDTWRSASPFRPPPNAPYAESTLAPSDSASQVAGRLYAAELAAQRLGGGQPTAGPGSSAQANPASQRSPTPASRFNLPSGAGAWRPDRKGAVPSPVPEVPEEEAVQHQDSGIRFRDGELVPPALALGQAHAGGFNGPHGALAEDDRELERPPEYEDARS